MSSSNTLDEVYKQWRDSGNPEDFRDIGISIVETANRIQISLDREKQEKITAEKMILFLNRSRLLNLRISRDKQFKD